MRIAAVSVARSDYGIYRSVFAAILQKENLVLDVIAGAAHLSDRFGRTVDAIIADGFNVAAEVPMSQEGDGPCDVAEAISAGVGGFSKAYAQLQPDLVLVLGDRYEMMAATLAATVHCLPIAHIHGGELSFGAIDDVLRHAITKMSHVHFVTTEDYGRRVVQLGENPDRVHVVGAPGLDGFHSEKMLALDELNSRFGTDLAPGFVLCTYHPVTLDADETISQFKNLLDLLHGSGKQVLFTMPNADAGGLAIRECIHDYLHQNPRSFALENMGTQGYFSAMSHAAAMVGNSSSGIIEAATFSLPVLNIGRRQEGRTRGKNVIDATGDTESLRNALEEVLDPEFHASLKGMPNPYGDGHSGQRIADVLAVISEPRSLLDKGFHDLR